MKILGTEHQANPTFVLHVSVYMQINGYEVSRTEWF